MTNLKIGGYKEILHDLKSLIEKTRLREILEDSIKRYDEIQGFESGFNIGFETVGIFLQDYYGIPINEFNLALLGMDREKFPKEHSYDGYKEFWRKRQEEAHLP